MAGTIGVGGIFDIPTRTGLNGVRPRWPEQCMARAMNFPYTSVSMESGLDGRNNRQRGQLPNPKWKVSMESGLDGRNNNG